MCALVHDTPVNFRVNYALLAKAQAKASADGMSISELISAVLRRELKN